MLDVANLGFRVDASQLDRGSASLDRMARSSQTASRAATAAKAAMAGLVASLSVGAIIRASDRYVEMTNGLRVLGMTADQAGARIAEIGEIAKRTRSPLEATAQLYQRVSIASKDLGASQADVLRFTENVGLALAQQGGSAAQASGALMQLSQALAGGVVRAEEFNSILEGAYPIAQAAANGIDAAGGSVGRLRQLMIAGEISSKEFFDAILSQSVKLSAAFADTVPTVGQAMQVLRDQWMLAVGEIASGTNSLASAILKVADGVATAAKFINENMNQIIGVVTAAAVAYAATLVPAIIAATRAILAQVTALTLLRTAMIRTGIGALVVLAGTLIGKFLDLVEVTGGWGKALTTLGDLARLVWQGIVASASAIPPGLAYVWNAIRGDFYMLVSDLQNAWSGFLRSLRVAADTLGMAGVASSISEKVVGSLEASTGSANKARDAYAAMNEAGAKAGSIVADAFAPVGAKMAELAAQADAAAAAAEEAGVAASGAGAAATAAGGAGAAGGKKAAGGAAAAAAATKDLIAELHKELDAREALIGLHGDERKRVEALQQVHEKLGDEVGKYTKAAIQGAADRMVAIDKETEAWEAKVQRMEGLTDDLSGAFGDWISRGLRDFKDFTGSILDSFKRMISDMIATAVRNPIQIAVQTVMGGVPGMAAAGAPGGGILGGIGGKIGGIVGGALTGFTSVFKGLFSGGLSGAAGALTGALGGATSGLAGMATAIGAIAAPVAIVAGLFAAFKGKTKELDAGMRVTVKGMDTLVETFRKTEKSRFFGLSKKRKTSYDVAPDEVADPIEAVVAEMQQGVLDAAKALGVGADAFEGFAHSIELSTAGMSEDEAIRAIQEELGKLGDAFADLIPDLSKFAHEGEGAATTLDRLSTSLGVVNAAFGDLGLALYEMSVQGAGAAASFVDLFGGLDNFARASAAYYEAFYSDAERLARLTTVSTQAIRDAGLAVPATREAYRQLVEAQNLATEAGREAVALLIQLAPAFDQIFTAAGDAITAASLAAQDAQNVRSQLLNSLMTEAEQAAAQQSQITAVFASLNMVVPTTLAGLRAVVAGLDLTGEAGRDALAKISGIADALKNQLTPSKQASPERSARAAVEKNTQAIDRMREAMQALDINKFGTRVDYDLAVGRMANTNAKPEVIAKQKAQEDRQARDSATLIEMRDYLHAVVNNTHRSARETRDLRMLQEGGVA